MKNTFTLLFLLCITFCFSQNLLTDGSLENHNSTVNCDYNNTETAFNAHFVNLTSIPEGIQEIDIIKNLSTCEGSAPILGDTKLILRHALNLNKRDGFSISLTTPMITNHIYEVSWYMETMDKYSHSDGEIKIGISNSPNTFGTLVLSRSSPLTPPSPAGFTLVTGTFTATSNATYLTVQANATNSAIPQCWIGVDGFSLVDLGCQPNFAGVNQLTGTQSVIADYETDGLIESNQIIDANVDYDSKIEIHLLSGFEVKLGREFHAFIDGCGNL